MSHVSKTKGTRRIHPDVPKYARCPSCAALVRVPDNLPYCTDGCRVRALPSYLRPKKKAPEPLVDRAIEAAPEPIPDWVHTDD